MPQEKRRKYNKVHGDGASRLLSKTAIIERITAEYGDKYAVGHIGDFIDECRTNGIFKKGHDYVRNLSRKEDAADTSFCWFNYHLIKPRLEEAVKARGVKSKAIYKALGINKQQFEYFLEQLEAAIFNGDTRITPNFAILGYYRDNYRRNDDGKIERATRTPYSGHQFSEAMVAEMKKLYRILIDGKRGRPKQQQPNAAMRTNRESG